MMIQYWVEKRKKRLISTERLEGRISPKVLVHGKTLIVEEYLDPDQWPSLEMIEKKGSQKGGTGSCKPRLLRNLLSKRIHYDQENFL